MARPEPTPATKTRIHIEFRGFCYYPLCRTPSAMGRSVVSIVAHICVRNEGGPRFNPALDDRAVNDDSNLIVLCGPHHKIVDEHPDEYTAEILHEWKRERVALTFGDSPLGELLKILLPDELADWSLEAGAPEFIIISRSSSGHGPARRYGGDLEVRGDDVKVFARLDRAG